MKRILFNLTAVAVMLGFAFNSQAQCPNNNTQYGSTSAASWSVGSLNTLSSCMYGGEYRYVYGFTAGFTYSFETCGDSDFDTQITIYDAATGAVVGYNDDFCGLQSKVTFVSNGNPVRVLIDRYFCASQSSCMTLRGTLVSGAPASNPCDDATALTCGSTGSFSLNGAGEWNNLGGPWSTPGEEAVYSFTATVTGTHTVSLTNSGYYVDIYYKTGSCGPTGWTYGDDIFSSGSISISMTAGTTYYLLVDDENTSASNGTITVSCPTPVADPCDDITPIASCGSSASFSLSAGNGSWNPPGPWGTPGQEQVFSFTPSISGAYPIQVTNSGYYVDLFIKTGSCGSSGWTYVSDIFSNETNNVNLTAGVTYLFLIDDENTSPSSGTITVGCPCIPPPGGIDESITVTSNTSYSSTTIGACNDCSLRSSNDRVLEVVIPCAGTYTFTTCNLATWDTYLYLTTAPCGGSIIALNDDACGLRSSITASLQPGTYYLAIEGFSSFSQGAFTVDISKSCDLSLSLNANVQGCGFNVSCNGGNDGSVTASTNGCDVSYAWSNGATTQTNDGLTTGYYTINVNDGFGCTASGAIYLTEPTALIVDAGEDQTVFYGYDPLECADLSASASGGCGPYTYSWADQAGGNYVTANANDNWFGFMNVFENPADPNPCCGGGYVFGSFWGVPDLATTLDGGANKIILQPNFNTYNANDGFWSDGNGGGNKIMDANTLIEPAGLNGQDLTFRGTVTDHTLDLNRYTAKFFIKALDPANGYQDALGGSAVVDLPLSGDFSITVDGASLAPGLIVQCGFVINGLNANPADAAALGSVTIEGAEYTSLTVCPSTSTNYVMNVTDANGCTASDDVQVCVIDVVCYAGNSGNEKVEICHRTGNGSTHTLCVAADAVQAHLDHGDLLGSCDEVNSCGPQQPQTSAMTTNQNNTLKNLQDAHLELFPNPATEEVNVHFDTDLKVTSYTIVNALGQIVDAGNINNGNASISIASFETGVYYFNVDGHLPVIFVKK